MIHIIVNHKLQIFCAVLYYKYSYYVLMIHISLRIMSSMNFTHFYSIYYIFSIFVVGLCYFTATCDPILLKKQYMYLFYILRISLTNLLGLQYRGTRTPEIIFNRNSIMVIKNCHNGKNFLIDKITEFIIITSMKREPPLIFEVG